MPNTEQPKRGIRFIPQAQERASRGESIRYSRSPETFLTRLQREFGQATTSDARALEREYHDYYQHGFTDRERADLLYTKYTAYLADRQFGKGEKESEAGKTTLPIDPAFAAEVRALLSIGDTAKIFTETYMEAQQDRDTRRSSELAQTWARTAKELRDKRAAFQQLERSLFLGETRGATARSSAETRAAMLMRKILELQAKQAQMRTLHHHEHPEEHIITRHETDVAALFAWEDLQRYAQQYSEGFVWTDSREALLQRIVRALENGQSPLLSGETGTGKSSLADAAAEALTGEKTLTVACSEKTSAVTLVARQELDAEGSYESYGPLMQALTGYENSRQTTPTFPTGRICRLDEVNRLGPEVYALLKEAHEALQGRRVFHGKKILPGAGIIATMNPAGSRYADRAPLDPAMRREFMDIPVDHLPQTSEHPELYLALLAALIDPDHHHILVAQTELSPAFTKQAIPEDQQVEKDGKIVVATEELIPDPADPRHGTLWRFANAIRALQDGFAAGGTADNATFDSLLRINGDDVHPAGSGGEPLVFSEATQDIKILKSWMKGLYERLRKNDQQFHTRSFAGWVNMELQAFLRNITHQGDRRKAEALFRYFHLLDTQNVKKDTEVAGKPMTPKDIGYLDPRVPRAPEVKSAKREVPRAERQPSDVQYTDKEVTGEDGRPVRIHVGPIVFTTRTATEFALRPGDAFTIGADALTFSGMHADPSQPDVAVCELQGEGEGLHRELSVEALDLARLNNRYAEVLKTFSEACPVEARELTLV